MYPIILCSIISLAIFLERWYVLRHSRERVDRYLRLRCGSERLGISSRYRKNQLPPLG